MCLFPLKYTTATFLTIFKNQNFALDDELLLYTHHTKLMIEIIGFYEITII